MTDNERLATIIRTATHTLELRLRDTHSKCAGCACVAEAFRDIAAGIATADADGAPVDAADKAGRIRQCDEEIARWSEKAEYARCGGERNEAEWCEKNVRHWRGRKEEEQDR